MQVALSYVTHILNLFWILWIKKGLYQLLNENLNNCLLFNEQQHFCSVWRCVTGTLL